MEGENMSQSTLDEPAAFPMPQENHMSKVIALVCATLSIILGITAGYALAIRKTQSPVAVNELAAEQPATRKIAEQNARELKPNDIRDSAEGTIALKPQTDIRKQGSHILKRSDAPWPIYLISSTVDLTQYEGKKVKIYGVTYDGGTKDWHMEVNKVE